MKIKAAEISYHPDACEFVREAVNYAIRNAGEMRHVSALELLDNCKRFAQEEYGFLARNVLESWQIKCADDIGDIVYYLIEKGKLSASPGDAREDFSVDFDLFDENSFRIKPDIDLSKPVIVD